MKISILRQLRKSNTTCEKYSIRKTGDTYKASGRYLDFRGNKKIMSFTDIMGKKKTL
jgi:hypothetical protein